MRRPTLAWALFATWSLAAVLDLLIAFDAALAPAGEPAVGWYLITTAGDFWITVALSVFAIGWAWWRRRGPVQVATALLLTRSLTSLTKLLVGRDRPGDGLVVVTSDAYPSGHTSMAVVLFALVLPTFFSHPHTRRAALVAGWSLAALVGASRVALRVHWPTDVVGGALLAWACWETARWIVIRWDGPANGAPWTGPGPGRRRP